MDSRVRCGGRGVRCRHATYGRKARRVAYPAPRGRDRGAAAPPPARGAARTGAVRLARPPDRRRHRRHPALLEPRRPPPAGLRRDVLRQAGLVDDPLRRRDEERPGPQRGQADRPELHRRQRPQGLRPDHRRPRRPSPGRQVADRLGRAAVRDRQQLRLAVRGLRHGRPVDPHDRPRRPAAVRVVAPRHRRRPHARVRGTPLRPLPHRPARPHPHVLGVRGVLLPPHRPRRVPQDPGPQGRRPRPRRPHRARSLGSVDGLASVAARRRGMPRAGLRDQVVRRLLPRRLRADDGPVGHGCPPRRRHHPLEDRVAGQGHAAGAALDGRDHRRRLLPQLVGLVRDRDRLQPPLGRHPPRGHPAGAGSPTRSGRGGTTTPRSSSSTPT